MSNSKYCLVSVFDSWNWSFMLEFRINYDLKRSDVENKTDVVKSFIKDAYDIISHRRKVEIMPLCIGPFNMHIVTSDGMHYLLASTNPYDGSYRLIETNTIDDDNAMMIFIKTAITPENGRKDCTVKHAIVNKRFIFDYYNNYKKSKYKKPANGKLILISCCVMDPKNDSVITIK